MEVNMCIQGDLALVLLTKILEGFFVNVSRVNPAECALFNSLLLRIRGWRMGLSALLFIEQLNHLLCLRRWPHKSREVIH